MRPRPFSLVVPLLSVATVTAQAPEHLHLLGKWTTHVERVRETGPGEVTLTLLGLPPTVAVERGDRLRIETTRIARAGAIERSLTQHVMMPPTVPGDTFGRLPHATDPDEVVTGAVVARDTRDPAETGRVHVRVRLDRPTATDRLAAATTEHDEALPPRGADRDAYVLKHAPRAVLSAIYQPEKGDRLADFLRVEAVGTGEQVDPDSAPTQCRFVLRFSEPVDPNTIGMELVRLRRLAAPGAPAPANAVDEIVPTRVHVLDPAGTSFAVMPPLGLAFDQNMRDSATGDRPHYALDIVGGPSGIRARTGRTMSETEPASLPITIDPGQAINLAGWRLYR